MSELFSINSDDTVVSDALLRFVNPKTSSVAPAAAFAAPAAVPRPVFKQVPTTP